jgi:excisionase family DNA binding protein
MSAKTKDDELISARQAAAIIGCGIRTAQRMAQRGDIPATRLPGSNGQYVYKRQVVEEYRRKLDEKFAQEYE